MSEPCGDPTPLPSASGPRDRGSGPPVLVVGDLAVDVVAVAREPLARGSDAAADIRSAGGGGGANTAAWLASAGVPVRLVCRVGYDLLGRAAVAELRDAGVHVGATPDPALPTATCIVLVEAGGERTMLPDRGAAAALSPADLPDDAFVAGGHLHLSGYVLLHEPSRPAGLAALERARAAGMSVTVDPASAAPLRTAGPERFLTWVAGATLLPNADEATVLTGADDPAAAAQALAARGFEVVVTLGAGGAVHVPAGGGPLTHHPAPDAAAVDSTGAGDAFAAGWIAARRVGAGPAGALAGACGLGADAVVRPGARPTASGGLQRGCPRSEDR